ncbi:hypothetical protein ACWNT8_10220 [Pigmentibacter ruber]|nr:hypothetical protein GTC16762_19550 [Pigmentibacter ruber]
MSNLRYMIVFLFVFFLTSANGLQIKICADDFRSELRLKKNVENISIDILKKGVLELNKETSVLLVLEYLPLPRCLDLLKKGKIDGALNLSYNEERAKFLEFPPGSGPEEWGVCTSSYKVACSGYVLITLKSNQYNYDGDKKTFPKPVRVVRGYSIEKELKPIYHEDLYVGLSNISNIKQMIEAKNGSVVANFTFPINIEKFYEVSDQLKIHTKYITMRSYYIPLAKNSKLSKEFREKFWKAVSSVANDTAVINELLKSYSKN